MSSEFLTDIGAITEVRTTDPGRIASLARTRRRHASGVSGDSLLIIAADHPARGALSAGGRPGAMASRHDMLDRLRAALAVPGVDGVLATPDVLEDLLLLGALEGRLVFGSMNRGGLQGASFEIDDRFTAYDARTLQERGFDGGKMLTRIDLHDPATPGILENTAHAVTDLARHDLIAMVEPFISSRPAGPGTAVVNDLSPDEVIRSIHIAQGLGAASSHTWLKLPAVEDMERVMEATTLPTLILGGDPVGQDPEAVRASWRRALDCPPVRGLVVGRTLLYPPDDDVETAVRAAADMIR